MTTPIPGAYDPTARLRDLYRTAETALLEALSTAVASTIGNPDGRLLDDLRLQQDTRRILDTLTPAVMAEIDAVLDAAVLDGEQRANTDN